MSEVSSAPVAINLALWINAARKGTVTQTDAINACETLVAETGAAVNLEPETEFNLDCKSVLRLGLAADVPVAVGLPVAGDPSGVPISSLPKFEMPPKLRLFSDVLLTKAAAIEFVPASPGPVDPRLSFFSDVLTSNDSASAVAPSGKIIFPESSSSSSEVLFSNAAASALVPVVPMWLSVRNSFFKVVLTCKVSANANAPGSPKELHPRASISNDVLSINAAASYFESNSLIFSNEILILFIELSSIFVIYSSIPRW